jgi:endonuclease/exonuclease/phosphatase family metal-dependent hydrolase
VNLATNASRDFTALSWNLHKGRSPIGLQAWAAMRHWLHTNPADVYFLQEAHAYRPPIARTRAANTSSAQDTAEANEPLWQCQATDIATSLKLQLALGNTVIKQSRRHGNAILSPHPLVLGGHWDISAHRFEQRGMLAAKIAFAGSDITLLCVHLALTRGARLRQMSWIADWIEREVPSDPLILAGDLNDWRNDAVPLFGAIGLIEVATALGHKARTFPAFSPALALDKMLVRGLTPTEWVPPCKQAAWLSDHLPYMARLRLDY